MPRILCILILLLLILHQDNWFWTDGRLVFGFMPVGLFYHACLSVAATLVWWLAVRYAWPTDLENGHTAPRADARGPIDNVPTSRTDRLA